ncbi:MAG: V-type H+-transporting ATPase subunit a, partial [Streblomastix strix]
MREVLTRCEKIFERTFKEANESVSSYQAEGHEKQDGAGEVPLGLLQPMNNVRLNYLAGVISQAKLDSFHRMLYVALRGNVFFEMQQIDKAIQDPITKIDEQKSVFLIFFSGEQARSRILRLCSSFNASVYPYPETQEEHRKNLDEIEQRLLTIDTVQSAALEQRKEKLNQIQKSLKGWMQFIQREQAIYEVLNRFRDDQYAQCLIGEGWLPVCSVPLVQKRLSELSQHSSSQLGIVMNILRTKKNPPSFIRRTKFSEAIQEVVDSYGVANYREVNPALLSLFTFPFLFGLMFGDVGHGLILFLVGLVLVIFEKKFAKMQNEMLDYLYFGRYLILVMGLIAAFCGLMYNEMFSLSMNIFGFAHKCSALDKQCAVNSTYIIGVSPIWRQSNNYLTETNSIKMKLSIIVGVLHMLGGIILSLINAITRKSLLDIVFEFIPQFLLLLSLFGYLCFLVILKWLQPFSIYSDTNTSNKPQLIKTMIDMFLSLGKVEDDAKLFNGQAQLQVFLVVLDLFCILWMLIPKPIILIVLNNREKKKKASKERMLSQTTSPVFKPSKLRTSITAKQQQQIKKGKKEQGLNLNQYQAVQLDQQVAPQIGLGVEQLPAPLSVNENEQEQEKEKEKEKEKDDTQKSGKENQSSDPMKLNSLKTGYYQSQSQSKLLQADHPSSKLINSQSLLLSKVTSPLSHSKTSQSGIDSNESPSNSQQSSSNQTQTSQSSSSTRFPELPVQPGTPESFGSSFHNSPLSDSLLKKKERPQYSEDKQKEKDNSSE